MKNVSSYCQEVADFKISLGQTDDLNYDPFLINSQISDQNVFGLNSKMQDSSCNVKDSFARMSEQYQNQLPNLPASFETEEFEPELKLFSQKLIDDQRGKVCEISQDVIEIQNLLETDSLDNDVTQKKIYKNLLQPIKRTLKRLISLEEIQNPASLQQLIYFFENQGAGLTQLNDLFHNQGLRKVLAKVFFSNSLLRELQNTRITPKNKQLFLSKIQYLKKSFITGKLTHL